MYIIATIPVMNVTTDQVQLSCLSYLKNTNEVSNTTNQSVKHDVKILIIIYSFSNKWYKCKAPVSTSFYKHSLQAF